MVSLSGTIAQIKTLETISIHEVLCRLVKGLQQNKKETDV